MRDECATTEPSESWAEFRSTHRTAATALESIANVVASAVNKKVRTGRLPPVGKLLSEIEDTARNTLDELSERPAKLAAATAELKRALDFYDRAKADPDGLLTGAQRDGHEWLLKAARDVAALA